MYIFQGPYSTKTVEDLSKYVHRDPKLPEFLDKYVLTETVVKPCIHFLYIQA